MSIQYWPDGLPIPKLESLGMPDKEPPRQKRGPKRNRNPYGLTNKEMQVLQDLWDSDGDRYLLINKYVISKVTMTTHLNNLYTKLHCHTLTQLMIVAYKKGLIIPGEIHPHLPTDPTGALAPVGYIYVYPRNKQIPTRTFI